MKKTKGKRERYSIIISSGTDARKAPIVLSVSRRLIFNAVGAALASVLVMTGAFTFVSSQASRLSAQADTLESEVCEQSALLDSYSNELSALRVACLSYEQNYGVAERLGLLDGGGVLQLRTGGAELKEQEAIPADEQPSVPGKAVAVSTEDGYESDGLTVSAVQVIPMTEAIAQINADFQANINAQVEAIKASETFDDAKVEYAGDMDGDSYAVNNWADVLSIYAAATMYDELKFLTITPENIGKLRDIYNEMNQLEFYTNKTSGPAANADPNAPPATVTTLTVYVSVNSLTYSDGALLHDFDSKQLSLLERLMSPSYYTYFADLLGVDVYDGTKSEELQQIIASLPEGTKGEAIVKSALIRLGHPYSKSKRGSGNYVDCSYFVYWSYNQAGITIPTSSVEQARYCYNNGYAIEEKDLKPGDIIFWSKTSCHCGRWREIHHAGIYIGNNKVIEASSSKGRVVIRDLWSGGGEWAIAMYARPYTEETAAPAADLLAQG
jgi:cell wall-associated NlpC family hydrolase